jgi:dTMP kinase
MEQVGVGWATAGLECRSDHGARVGVAFELDDHDVDASDVGGACRPANGRLSSRALRGRLITIEGIDGAGKTTLAAALRDSLEQRGLDIHLLREPGGVDASERVRELVKDPDVRIGARAEALLYAAARAQLVEEALQPLLDAGSWVLLDRFVDSSLAYQGAGRDLGVDQVRTINRFATGGLDPDRTLLLQLDPAVARARSRARLEGLDRLESEADDFFSRTDRAYRELAAADPARIRVIDAGAGPESVLAAALGALEGLID